MTDLKDLSVMVAEMRLKDKNKFDKLIINRIKKSSSLLEKCILIRNYIKPQSIIIEQIIKNDLLIGEPIDSISGDGCKNGIRYEIKYSGHAKYSKLNFVQIRPQHNIDYYIFIAYLLYSDTSDIGEAYIFKIPAKNIYKLIVEYGNYAHGTKLVQKNITLENLQKNNYEYALRCNPFASTGKSVALWNEFLKFRVEYHPKYF